MDQIKIGAFLRELRKEHDMTQEAVADKFGTTQRSVSRWENGKTLPDISILIELADFYDVDLREILNGGRKDVSMNEDMKETLELVAEYTKEEKKQIARAVCRKIWVCLAAFLILGIIVVFRLGDNFWARQTAELCFVLGLAYEAYNFFDMLKLTGKISKKAEGKILFFLIFGFIALEAALCLVDRFLIG